MTRCDLSEDELRPCPPYGCWTQAVFIPTGGDVSVVVWPSGARLQLPREHLRVQQFPGQGETQQQQQGALQFILQTEETHCGGD